MFFQIPYLAYFGVFTSILVVMVGLKRFGSLRAEMRILLGFFVFALVANILSLIFAFRLGNNLWLYHFIPLMEFSIFVVIFASWLNTRLSRIALYLTIPLFFTVWFLFKYYIEDLRRFDNFSSSFESMLLIGISSYVLFTLFRNGWEKPGRDFRFWVLAAVLIYHTANGVFIALSNVIMNFSQLEIMELWSLHWLVGIIANYLFLVAFLTQQPTFVLRGQSIANTDS